MSPIRAAASPSRTVSRGSTPRRSPLAALFALAALISGGCAEEREEVVVYCALDIEFARQILKDFEQATGVPVQLQHDDEITKTVGLTNRIKLEKEHPKADVFWNNEIVNTIRLKNAGCLEPYKSPSASDIPDRWKDKDGHWTGFAARARVLIVNTEKCPEARTPKSMWDFVDPARKGEGAIAKPIAGTTASHLAVLFHLLGEDKAKKWWTDLNANQTTILTGNGPVMKHVRSGQAPFGFTDTDDYFVALTDRYPVKSVYPDQGPDDVGCLVIPNTISLVKGGPHPDLGRKFIDYVLSRPIEEKLAAGPSAQIPVREDVPAPPHVRRIKDLKLMQADFEAAATKFDAAQDWLTRPR